MILDKFLRLGHVGLTLMLLVGCQTEPQTTEPSPSPTPSVLPVAASQPDTFGDAVNKAMSAAQLTQTASTPEQWDTVAKTWQEAIALMKAVPQSSPNSAVARQKVEEYGGNLQYARRNAIAGSQETAQAIIAQLKPLVEMGKTLESLRNAQELDQQQECSELMRDYQLQIRQVASQMATLPEQLRFPLTVATIELNACVSCFDATAPQACDRALLSIQDAERILTDV